MKKETILVFLSSVFFATGGLFFKLIPWEPLAIGSARSILAGIAIFIFLKLRGHKFKINRTVLVSAVSIALCNTLYAAANKLTTAGNTIVLQFTMPVFVILIMLAVFHKKPSRLEILTCIFTFAGIVCFFIDALSAGNMTGNILAVVSGFCYAVFFVSNSREDSEPFTAILISYGITALLGLPQLVRTDPALFDGRVIAAVLALGLVQQGAGHICFAIGIKKTPAVAASFISGLEPILNPVLVAVFYHEMLTPLSLLGAAVVLVTIFYYNYRTSKEDKQNGGHMDHDGRSKERSRTH